MKTKLTLLVAAFCAALTLAAAAVDVSIRDADHVIVDGIDQGTIVDAVRNAQPGQVAPLQTALRAWAQRLTAESIAARSEANELRIFAANIVTAAGAELAKPTPSLEILRTLVVEAAKPRAARAKAELEKQIAELAAKKAALEAQP